jgi:alpha-ketoglutaric semialdehyde dehydrogenase
MSGAVVETLIGGDWVVTPERVAVFNPADVRETVAEIPALTGPQVVAAYDAAERGFQVWKSMSAFERADVLRRAAALLRQRVDAVAADVSAENGKTIAEATGEVLKAADFFEYYAGFSRDAYGTLLHDVRPHTRAMVKREPIGVVLAITPWNDPLLTPARKLAPALMCGNAAVLKPATETPLAGLHLARALHDGGLPAGALNVITGRTSEIADFLMDDPRIAAITFTGSNAVGEALRTRTASRNVRFQGELGGKNASVILADADLDVAVNGVLAASFGQAGQRCTATSRVIVDRSVADRFVEQLADRVSALTVGAPDDEATNVGPLVSSGHRNSVAGFVDRATAAGAVAVVGGTTLSAGRLEHGCYFAPTILTGIRPDMEIWRDEVFGPVVVVVEVDGLDEAIAATNDSDYGLSAAVYTTRLDAAERFADEVDCGQIAVNTSTSGWDVHFPFGGFRRSGSAFKEQGDEAIRFYTKVKTIAIHVPPAAGRGA